MNARTIAIAAAALALSAAVPSMAATIRLDTTAYSSTGGEFKVTVMSGYVGEIGGPSAIAANTFETFCLEHGEYFRPGDIYNVTLNTAAVGASGSDPLDARTAFLYTRFREGSLAGFDYNAAGRTASTLALQQAIWFLEDEAGGSNNAFVAQANAAVAIGGEWFGRGIGNVRVMNLSNGEFPNAQDQLTIIPLPATAGMGAAGLLIVGARRRRSR